MNKTKVLKELKGLWNTNKKINGYFIRCKGWAENKWQIVDSLDFDTCNVIEEFYYQKDLANRIKTK